MPDLANQSTIAQTRNRQHLFNGSFKLEQGLTLRPAGSGDEAFLEALHRDSRDDMRQSDYSPAVQSLTFDQQFHSRQQTYDERFPNARHLIIEKPQSPVGWLIVDFGPTELHLVDILFAKYAQGRGYGTTVLRAMQQAAETTRTPLTLSVSPSDTGARRLYLSLGFVVEESRRAVDLLAWYPDAAD